MDDSAPYDWNFAYREDSIVAGRGYITRQAPGSGSNIPFDYEFDGIFNNGEIEVDVTRNDENLDVDLSLYINNLSTPDYAKGQYDANSILLGNPYPSAINVSAFLVKNTYNVTTNPNGILDGYIAIWSAASPPIATNNGNQPINYNLSDYFYANSTGMTFNPCFLPYTSTETCVDSPTPPPVTTLSSGQGFFANFSDAVPANLSTIGTPGKVVFNNSMRRNGPNTNFYKTSVPSLSNRLWLNLNNPSGISRNILLGYVDGATSGDDGTIYDLRTAVPFNFDISTSLLYFNNVENSDSVYRIQGKNTNDLNSNEVVSLGFYNSIEGVDGVPEEFAISITNIEGDFISNRTTFLVDNLLDVCHDLTAAPYFFTSGIGEFNERFELRFQSCNYSEACNAIFDAFAGSIDTQGKCGKYSIKAPQGDYTGYNVVLTHDGIDINIPTNPANTTFLYTENGSNTAVLSIYDQGTGELCYRGDVDLEVNCFEEKVFILYPNPAKDRFTVAAVDPLETFKQVTVINLLGAVVKHSKTNSIELDGVKSGIYFVEIITVDGTVSRKQIIVE